MTAMLDDVEVKITWSEGLVRLFEGRALVKGHEIRFEGVVYPSVGGPNVGTRLSQESLEQLRALGYTEEEIEQIIADLNNAVLNGEARFVE
ncbi:hypothetical protein HRbin01_00450 [archaeon HR01]|nr:hypothetical protein HRbin01_00450 [archaeon HR01]